MLYEHPIHSSAKDIQCLFGYQGKRLCLAADDDILGMFGLQPAISMSSHPEAQRESAQAEMISPDIRAAANPGTAAKWMQPLGRVAALQPAENLSSNSQLLEEEELSLKPSYDSCRRNAIVIETPQQDIDRAQLVNFQPNIVERAMTTDQARKEVPKGVLTESNRLTAALESSAHLDPFRDRWNDDDVTDSIQECGKEQKAYSSNLEQPQGKQRQFRLPAFEDKAKARKIQDSSAAASARGVHFPTSEDQMPKHRLCKIEDTYASADEYKKDCLMAVEEEIGLRHVSMPPNCRNYPHEAFLIEDDNLQIAARSLGIARQT